MTSNILVADESETIQKVIKITLNDKSFNIKSCENVIDLNEKIKKDNFNLVLLDYALGGENKCFQLVETLRGVQRDLKIILMFSAFDVYDDKSLNNHDIDGKIIKPFDSVELINLVNRVLENGNEDDINFEEVAFQGEEEEELDSNNWEIKSTHSRNKSVSEKIIHKDKTIDDIISDWKMEIPPLISLNESKKELRELPPVMNEKFVEKPRFENLEDLKLDESMRENEKIGESTESFKLNDEDEEKRLQNIKNKIKDELTSEDFWAVDKIVREEISKNQTRSDEPKYSHELLNDLKQNIPTYIKPVVKECLEEMCKDVIEKVTWEILPQLAEDLVKKELEKMAQGE